MTEYKAVLIAPDGDWVTDFRECESIDEVYDRLNDMGSRWFFYPFHGVIIDHGGLTTSRQRLVSVAPPLEEFKGKTVKTLSKYLKDKYND
jgi:hypothetical protein